VTHIQPLPPSSSINKKSEILYGVENAVGRGVYFMSNVKQTMDIFFDHRAPSIVVDVEEYTNGYIDIRRRGGKIRAFTEITKDNVHYCKKLMKLVDELRHLDGVKGGVAVSESEYMATTVLQEAKPLTQVIYSNVKEVVEQAQYIFDTLWNTTIPAEEKIREIEEGKIPYQTKLIQESDRIIREIIQINQRSNEMCICATAGGIQFTYNYLFEVTNKLLEKYKRGEHKGIKYISNIDKHNKSLAKMLIDAGVQLRHVKNLPPMSFGVSDKQIGATLEKMECGKRVQSLLISNEPVYVKHFTSIFEELWNDGIDAAARIRDIEEGIESTNIDIVENPQESLKIAHKIIKSAKYEVLRIYPSINSFHRQVRVGAIDLFKQVLEHGVKVRILIPADEQEIKRIVNEEQLTLHGLRQLNIRSIDKSLQTHIGIIVVDRRESLIVESRDDTKDNYYDAAGLSAYSNSKPIALSYASIFENLWMQTELYEQLKQAHEQLKVHDKMQKEFINIAAHELRTPIQPIIGLAEVLNSKARDIEQRELLGVVIRNAKRLRRLTEDILDVTKIEGSSLSLNKEFFNLNEAITNTIDDIRTSTEFELLKNVELLYESQQEQGQCQELLVEADKARITQVIFNLLINAVKFTKDGRISITVTEKKDNNNNKKELIFSIKDTGSGIHPEILPRLFSKFATKSFAGTGLGLFISKHIIEAHGGKIWAENNSNGKGATFYFSIPLGK
jgi:two-component system, OmpR family, sensor histidine kinase VicK